jgi:hypothetical protein
LTSGSLIFGIAVYAYAVWGKKKRCSTEDPDAGEKDSTFVTTGKEKRNDLACRDC